MNETHTNVIQLPRAVVYRKCPGCGYTVPQETVEALRVDVECSRCGQYKQSDFVPIKLSNNRGEKIV